jgi:hypothetical protein
MWQTFSVFWKLFQLLETPEVFHACWIGWQGGYVWEEKMPEGRKEKKKISFRLTHQIITSFNSDFIRSKAKKMLPG